MLRMIECTTSRRYFFRLICPAIFLIDMPLACISQICLWISDLNSKI